SASFMIGNKIQCLLCRQKILIATPGRLFFTIYPTNSAYYTMYNPQSKFHTDRLRSAGTVYYHQFVRVSAHSRIIT
ncbi:MAG: hypothetical protein ACTS8P_01800, partial [Arsenophonus sp. NC-XBC3-MAG3]